MEIWEPLLRVVQINITAWIFPLVAGVTVYAGVSDARTFTISNRLTYPLMMAGIAYHSLLPVGGGLLFALAGFGFGLMVLLPFFLLGGVGAGDVKLLAGIGTCLGLHDTVAVFLVFGTLAAIYSAVAMLVRSSPGQVVRCERHPVRALSPTISDGHRIEDVLRMDVATGRPRLVPLGTMMAIALLILAAGRMVPAMLSSSP